MIRRLTIKDVALIEQLSIGLHDGLVVLSGETGAGKSIIVDAITLILGGRADRDLIRTGSEKATVEAEFDISGNALLSGILLRENIESDGESLIVYREISRNGRNTCRLNGVLVQLALLRETAAVLLNLHGQSEHQFLADEEKHLKYLDLMGDESHRRLLEETGEAYQAFIRNHRTYAKMVRMNENRDIRLEILSRELEELRRADLQPGLENSLADEARRLNKASRIHEKISLINRRMSGGEDGTDVLYDLRQNIRELRNLSSEDIIFSQLADKCENIFYEAEDLAHEIDELSRRYEFDPVSLEHVENRLESVRKAVKKYGPSEEDALLNLSKLEEEFNLLQSMDERLRDLGAEHKRLLIRYRVKAKELSESRKNIAASFEKDMITELKDLGMEHTVFRVSFAAAPEKKPIMPTPEGDDQVRFLFSANPGEPLKPIASIASGGELSRLMLALKTIEAGRGGIQTMIFDEIDTGISGRMAQAVSEKMISISRHQQVICISHLPQIAAAADHQYLVYKSIRDGRTVTDIKEMDRSERMDEIGRMISGAEGITSDAREYAGQMIAAADRKKK